MRAISAAQAASHPASVAASSAGALVAAARVRGQPAAVAAQAHARPGVEAVAGVPRAAAVAAAPAAVAVEVLAAAAAPAALAVEAAVEVRAPAAESAAQYSAAAAEPVVQPAAFRHPRHPVDADHDVPRAAPAARLVHSLPVESWMALLSARWFAAPRSAAAPSANLNLRAVLTRRHLAAAVEAVMAAALARAQPTASVPRLEQHAADAFLAVPSRFCRAAAEQ